MFKTLYNNITTFAGFRPEAGSGRTHTEDEQFLLKLCGKSVEQALQAMESRTVGLDDLQVSKRLARYGKNEISQVKRPSFLQDIVHRLTSPLVIQLLIIALVSAVIGELKSSAIVGMMILLSVGISYVLDRRSGNAVASLGKRVQSRSHVIRNGVEREVPQADLVPGDIVRLQAGSVIPADLRLVSTKDFFVSQASLTGETMPVEKNSLPCTAENLTILELGNACFQGSSVSSGSALAVVVNTGSRSFFGAIAESLNEKRQETSFDKGIRSFTWLMIRFMVVLVSSVFLIVGLSKGNWMESLLFSLSVAVGLTPEMLPMIVTVNLAKGALVMAGKKVIVKHLSSIQNFGAIDILCTDKTGTLTQDRVLLKMAVDLMGEESNNVLKYAYLNSFFQTGLSNLLDRAVLDHQEFAVDGNCLLVDELPFDFQRRRMSVVVSYRNDHVLICKGAVEEIYACCNRYQIADEIYPLIGMIRDDLFEEVAGLNGNGYRVLAIAYNEFPPDRTHFTHDDEKDLILLGYIAFLDPPKDSTAAALVSLRDAGVGVKILTGDNALVTGKICRDVGFEVTRVATGDELDRLAADDFDCVVEEAEILAKLSPMQKAQVVKSLRKGGHVVGYMGDGINDAPALRAADVGISVDSAVDVAKESADIVLLEKSLMVLGDGIMEGRRVFANIIKYVRMSASSNFGNMFSVIGASYLLPFLPMQPIQILLNNLLYDLSQTGIPADSVDAEQISKPRKWDIGNIKWFMIVIGPISSIFDYATFALMWFFFGASIFSDPTAGAVAKSNAMQLFQTGWFVESLLTQTLIVHIIRTGKIPFLQSQASMPMMVTTLAVMLVAVWLPYSPVASLFGMIPLPIAYFGWIGLFLLAYGMMTHVVKSWFFKRFGGN
ncbi:MAG: magnesium-translocating P-type ATPase [Chlorobiaceae bacterium]|nr:magnesium-translocating P-type ATPase [Chlorobiaceae bacterium]